MRRGSDFFFFKFNTKFFIFFQLNYALLEGGLPKVKDEVWKHFDDKRLSQKSTIYFSKLTKNQIRQLYQIYKLDFELFDYSIEPYLTIAENRWNFEKIKSYPCSVEITWNHWEFQLTAPKVFVNSCKTYFFPWSRNKSCKKHYNIRENNCDTSFTPFFKKITSKLSPK